MSFFDEIRDIIGFVPPATGYNIIDYNGEIVYAEGIRCILTFDTAEVRLEARHALITVEGEGLTVKNLDEGSAVIAGSIAAVRTEKR